MILPTTYFFLASCKSYFSGEPGRNPYGIVFGYIVNREREKSILYLFNSPKKMLDGLIEGSLPA